MKNSSKFKLLKILFFVFLLSGIITIVGCWDRHELDSLGIVLGMAIDKGEEEASQVEITAQIIKPGEIKGPSSGGGGSGGGKGQPYLNITNKGEAVFDTLREFTHVVNRRLYVPHNEILLIGQEVAEEGVGKYLDLFFRDPEPRLTSWLIVTRGKAKEVLDTKAELEQVPALSIAQLVEARAATSEISAVKLQDFMTRLMSKTTAPVASLLEVESKGEEKIARLVGTAVFKREKMVGSLDKAETRGLLWVLGKVQSGIIVTSCPGGGGKACLEIIRAKSKVIPEIKGGKLEITVKIKEEGNLGGQMCTQDLTLPETWIALEKNKAKVIQQEVKAALQKAQALNTDIFGFGETVHRKYPALWKEWEAQWNEIFPILEVKVSVEAKLRQTGMIMKPVKPE
ncbi:MAG: Ger(x)C family spore germination protein [Peptococcia bacterium]